MKLFKRLSEKLSTKTTAPNHGMIKPVDVDFDLSKNEFLDNLTKHAVDLYEKKMRHKKLFKACSF